jgi:hypothetical protein
VPKSANEDPTRTNDRTDSDEPRRLQPRTDILDPNRAAPNREKDEPKRAKELNDRELPMSAAAWTATWALPYSPRISNCVALDVLLEVMCHFGFARALNVSLASAN